MNKLHKMISVSLTGKLYFLFFLFISYGWYKNAWVPYANGYYAITHLFLVLLYPLCGLGIGALFDFAFKNKNPFNNKFYGLLFSLLIPISTNICIFLIVITILLFMNTFLISRKDWDLHFIVLGKLLLVGILYYLGKYNYANLLEESHLFVYSYMDGIFGNNVSGLFISSTFITILSLILLCFDTYYKKEIPLYSYGIYLVTLVFYGFWKSDMVFILNNMFSSTVLFVLVILAPLSSFSPYSKKRIFFYSVLLGLLILPFSLLTNFFEGVYISTLFVNFILIFLNGVQIHLIRARIHQK